MRLHRREFFAISGGAVAWAAARSAQAGKKPVPGDAFAAFRASLDLDPAYVHMAGLLLASHPRPLRDAIEGFRRELDRNPVGAYHEHHETRSQAARQAAARYVGGQPDEIALTDSTTMGLGIVYGGFQFAPGDDILTTTEDHYSTHEALRFRTLRGDVTMRKVTTWKDPARATEAEIVGRLSQAILPNTRLLALTWVHTKTGVKMPIQAIAAMVAQKNKGRSEKQQIIFSVDGVHGFGVENLKAAQLGCDVFTAGCHKWLFGPRGTGIVWAKPATWNLTGRTIPAFEGPAYGSWLRGIDAPSTPGGIMMTPGGFHSFEHRWALPVAFENHEKLGGDRIQAHIHGLSTQVKQGLKGMKHVTLHTPMSPKLSSGVVCFEVSGMQPEAVIERLLQKKIIGSTTPYTPTYARLTPGLINTAADVDAALAAVRDLA